MLSAMLLAAALVAAAPPAAAAAPLLRGHLSPPSAAPAEAVARRYLASAPRELALGSAELAPTRTFELRQAGSLVRFAQRHAGVPVWGRGAAVRVDAAGRVRWARSAVAVVPAGLSITPRLAPADAVARVLAGPLSRRAGLAIDPRGARLVLLPLPGGALRLAYVIIAPADLVALAMPRVFVDAQSGAILRVENLVQRGDVTRPANVFTGNPVSTPALAQEDLAPWLGGSVTLDSADLTVRSCVDSRMCRKMATPLGEFDVLWCDEAQLAASDGPTGDFLAITRPAADTAVDDAFAEVQMFWHVSRIYDYFRDLGFDTLPERPLSAVVNFRIPDVANLPSALCQDGVPQASGRLVAFDNALYTPAGGLFGYPPADSIIFGQGTTADFAYDGDVVYHEFTHAVMFGLSPELGFWSLDAYGLDPTTGGLHEGTADYFSSAFLDDPELGEYTGTALGAGGALRTLLNSKTCPEDLWGEVHQDGEAWAAALWAARQTFSEETRADFDRAVLTVVSAMDGESDQPNTAAAIVAEVEVVAGEAASQAVAAAFTARGIDGCDARVLRSSGASHSELLQYVQDPVQVGLDLVPGPLQVELTLAAPATAVIVDVAQVAGQSFLGNEAPQLRALVKRGGPIAWTYVDAVATHDADAVAELVLDGTKARAVVPIALPAGKVTVQLASVGVASALQGIEIRAGEAPAAPDAGPGGDGGPGADDDGGGCGCSVGARGGTSAGAWLGLVGLVAGGLGVRRRRR